MSSYLTELASELEQRGSRPVTTGDLIRALYAIDQAFEEIEKNRGAIADTVAFVNQLQERLVIVDELPLEAPLGALIRRRTGTVAQRAALYTGNGQGQPLARLVPVPL